LVFVASEMAPWSKTGGLGDVMGALPKAMAKRGHRVMAIAPRYDNYPEALDTGVRWQFPIMGGDQEVGYFHAIIDGVDFVFIDHSCFHHVKDSIYAGELPDQSFRFQLLCRAALEAVWHVKCGVDPLTASNYGDDNTVFIANDWQTSLLPVFLQAYYRDHGKMLGSRSIIVLHNCAFQGRGPYKLAKDLNLPEHYREMTLLDDPFGGECMNMYKAGLMNAHRWVAVSTGYAWEVQTDMGGKGLAPVLRDESWKMNGIVNGIDYAEWSPEIDKFLTTDGYVNFPSTREGLLDGKAQCKAALQAEFGLPIRPDVPLLGFIGRLDPQKGVDNILEARHWLGSQDCQVVMLGSGDPELEGLMREMEQSNNEKFRCWVGFSVSMSHRITAGADMFLMPSRFEPCGLNQLYSMRYGTVPIVRAVGGLRDTVQQYDPWKNEGTGWSYEGESSNDLIDSISNALGTYREHRESFIGIAERGMQRDSTWNTAAEAYEKVIVQAKFDDYRG